jgi:hypothetical protein
VTFAQLMRRAGDRIDCMIDLAGRARHGSKKTLRAVDVLI